MKTVRNVLKWLAALQCLMFAIITISAADESVCFKQKGTDRIRICRKFKGKHDAFPRYECPESGKQMPFDPKDEWEILKSDDPLCKPDKEEAKSKSDVSKGNGDDKAQSEKTPEKPASSEDKGDKP